MSWKAEQKANAIDTRTSRRKGSGSQELPSTVITPNNDVGTVAQPQLAKRQRKKTSTERSGHFMDIVKSTLIVGHSSRDGEVVNTLEALDLGNNENQVGKFDDCNLVLMHQNMQNLNNKLLDIAMMLTVDNLHINILRFTAHWFLEDQMNVLNIYQFRLVSKFCRRYSTSGGSCIFTRNAIQTK
jgi:hypothetical protein